MLQVNEIFYSFQGEGTHTGIPAVFVRLAGCNLSCRFCDTDYSLKALLGVDDVLAQVQTLSPECPTVILTGGEPLAQTQTPDLIDALARNGRRVHIESNGTVPVPLSEDVWLTVSPKERLHSSMAARANEIKLIVDERVPLEWLDQFPLATPAFLQPENNKPKNVALAMAAIAANPKRLRLSVQTHKLVGAR
ncbi:MAG: 7-carboxy-7-deazaguanine synthase [Candidatus Meridianibacter frigidus]|nr:MAG: 7-carboxy-7-deazaguanine synthase [Candidatus Eremiobacteraeota bacterium]